jgi:hypothetical protein
VTPEELAALRRLIDEFRNELTQLGANVRDMQNRLDALTKDVADIKDQLARMPKISGDFFQGFRSDQSRYNFYDYSGAFRNASQSLFSNVNSPSDFHLGVTANLPEHTQFKADLFASNYTSYRANPVRGVDFDGSFANNNGQPAQVGLYQAALDIPIAALNKDTFVTVGRFKQEFTPLTYWRPDTDAYFDVPWYDDGNYVQDGIKFSTKFGSATSSLFAASYTSTTTSNGFFINRPQVGATVGPRFTTTFKPVDATPGDQGAGVANQVVGVHAAVPITKAGEVALTWMDFSNGGEVDPSGQSPPFTNVMLYGVNGRYSFGHFHFSAEGAKTVTQISIDKGDGRNNDQSTAYQANINWASGPANASAGYQYIDPAFGAPGYWNKIGNWYNPTNIQGPYARLGWKFTKDLSVDLGGDYYFGARNRPGVSIGGFNTGFRIADDFWRGTAAVHYNIGKMFGVSAAYEGVFWYLGAPTSATGSGSKPVEQYITFGANWNMTSNAVLRLAYQIINFQDVGGGFGGSGVPGSLLNGNSNASVFTTQVAVHF